MWGATCELCKQDHVISMIQVDHIDGGAYSLKNLSDIQNFFESIVLVTESDLRLLCKDCNYTCTYAKRMNISLEEAFCTKYVIKMVKEDTLKQFFSDRELPLPKTKVKQREQALEILKSEVRK